MEKQTAIIKKDTFENWSKAKNFIPKESEIIVYIDKGMKIGDGKTRVNDLPFINNNEYRVEDDILIINTRKGD